MAIEIKGITLPVLLVKLDDSLTAEGNISEIEKKLSVSFFKDSLVVIGYNNVNIDYESKKRVEDMLRVHNTNILGYKPLSGDEDFKIKRPQKIEEKSSLKTVNKTLRSGQRIEHDGDLLIIGSVNPEAYVVAAGNIIVMGTLSGFVHAGVHGNESAVVIALKLRPQQLRIGSHITRSPDNMGEPEYPERAFVSNNQIFIEKL